MELKNGQVVNLTNGGYLTADKGLGRGGQGIVYLVNCGGKRMALKWYHNPPEDKFYKSSDELTPSEAEPYMNEIGLSEYPEDTVNI